MMAISEALTIEPASRSGSLLLEDREASTFRVSREAFRSQEVFDRERRLLWDRHWLYLGHESELAKPGDFKVRTVAGRSLILCRSADGELHAYLNACPHRGTILCRENEGNSRFFRCFYHAWTFDNFGRLVSLPGEESYAGQEAFRDRVGLREIPKFDSHCGFLFGSFNEGAEPLQEHLGEAADFIRMVSQHSGAGMEVLQGTQLYGVRANWKLAIENALDGYHFAPTHSTFIEFRKDSGYVSKDANGEWRDLGHGHYVHVSHGFYGRAGLEWEPCWGEEERIRIEGNRRELASRLGEERAQFIAANSRILYLFPNLLLFDILGISIWMLEPVAPGFTSVNAWELAPRDEPPSARALRLDHLLTFVGPGGFSTPDDIEAYECIQRGVEATKDDPRPGVDWNDLSRGLEKEYAGNHTDIFDEGNLRAFWRNWDTLVNTGADGRAR
jgi:phenylpropionate dioxygenase-like ring-hydroxylating dioxygenase large terminal subunit